MEGRTPYQQPLTILWSSAQHHVTISLMKLAADERNVATNFQGCVYKNIIIDLAE